MKQRDINLNNFDLNKDLNQKLNLFLANEKNDLKLFYKHFLEENFRITNPEYKVFYISNLFFLEKFKSILKHSIFNFFNLSNFLIEKTDVENIFETNQLERLNKRLSSYMANILEIENQNQFEFNFSIKMKEPEFFADENSYLLKKLWFFKVLNEVLKNKDYDQNQKIILLIDDLDFLNNSKTNLKIYQEIIKLGEVNNISIIGSFSNLQTLNYFAKSSINSYLLYRNKENDISIKELLNLEISSDFNLPIEIASQSNLIKSNINHYDRLFFLLRKYKIDIFENQEIIIVYDKILEYIILEELKFDNGVYYFQNFSDLVYLISFVNHLKQNFKVKVIFSMDNKTDVNFKLIEKFLHETKIKWTIVNLDKFDFEELSFSKLEKSQNYIWLISNISSFLEQRISSIYQNLNNSDKDTFSEVILDNVNNPEKLNNLDDLRSLEEPNGLEDLEVKNFENNSEFLENLENIIVRQIHNLSFEELKIINDLREKKFLNKVLITKLEELFKIKKVISYENLEFENLILNILKQIAKMKIIIKKSSPPNLKNKDKLKIRRWKK